MADVVTITGGTAGSLGSMANAIINDLRPDFLAVAEFGNETEKLFRQEPINNSTTKQWNRLERVSIAATPATATEGVTPDTIGLPLNSITAALEQYITGVKISELAEMTTRNPIIQGHIRNLGLAAKETRAHVLYNIINAATNVFRINDRANDNATLVGDKITVSEISEVRSALGEAGTPSWPDGTYHMVIPPRVQGALEQDPDWKAKHQFVKNEALEKGAVHTVLMGCTVIATNDNSYVATASTTSGNSSKIYSSFICGPDALAVTDLQAVKLYVKPPGSGETDYAHQRTTLAFKMSFKGVILDNTFLRKVRSSGINATAVA